MGKTAVPPLLPRHDISDRYPGRQIPFPFRHKPGRSLDRGMRYYPHCGGIDCPRAP